MWIIKVISGKLTRKYRSPELRKITTTSVVTAISNPAIGIDYLAMNEVEISHGKKLTFFGHDFQPKGKAHLRPEMVLIFLHRCCCVLGRSFQGCQWILRCCLCATMQCTISCGMIPGGPRQKTRGRLLMFGPATTRSVSTSALFSPSYASRRD